MSTPSDWQRLESLFEHGVALPAAARDGWLDGLQLEPALRQQLERMLACDRSGATIGERLGAALAGAAQAPMLGDRLGPWRLLEPIGSGGMGSVFLVERVDGGFSQQAALKLIRGIATGEAIRRLRRERQLLASLDHPGIARLLDGGETTQGQPYLVLEYVRGEPITRAAARRRLTLRERIALLREVALAVHHAHRQLIIHRDIKPANVLLREDGRPVLLDFGIATLLAADPAEHTGTMPYFTPAYASPEQRAGRPVGTATDIYALGLLLTELITDQPPTLDDDGRPRPPSERVPRARRGALRGDLDRIVARACAVEPERRYPSAEALADDLERHLDARPIRAAPDSRWYVAGKFVRRHPVGVAAGLAAALLLALSGGRIVDERNRALAAEARALAESQAAAAATDFLVELFREADPHAGGGRSLSPLELIEHGVERLAPLPAPQRARLAGTLGDIFFNLGEPTRAAAVLDDAITAARSSGAAPAELAGYLGRRGLALYEAADYLPAEAVLVEAVALARQAGDRDLLSRRLGELGMVQAGQRRFEAAEPNLQEAIALSEALHGPDHAETARLQTLLAEMLHLARRLDEADRLMEHAIVVLRAALPADDPHLLVSLLRHAFLALELRRFEQAERVMLEVLAIRERLFGAHSARLGTVHSGLGKLYHLQGRTADAARHFGHALEISERLAAPGDIDLALMRQNLAAMYIDMGDYPAAETLLRAAVAALDAHPGGAASYVDGLRQQLARLLLLTGPAEEARTLVERPLADGQGAEIAAMQVRQFAQRAEWHRRYGSPQTALEWIERAEAALPASSDGEIGFRQITNLQTRGLIEHALGRHAAAQRSLDRVLEQMTRLRGEAYIGRAGVLLALAAIALDQHEPERVRAQLDESERVMRPVLVEHAPQWQELAALRQRLDEARQ